MTTLVDRQQETWGEFVARHFGEDHRAAMARAQFDDVRPDWSGYHPTPPVPAPVDPALTAQWAAARALFDDVRTEWEAHLTAKR